MQIMHVIMIFFFFGIFYMYSFSVALLGTLIMILICWTGRISYSIWNIFSLLSYHIVLKNSLFLGTVSYNEDQQLKVARTSWEDS